MSHANVPQEFSTTLPDKRVPRECPTRVSNKSVLQECPARVSHKSVLQECPTRVPDKSVLQCPTQKCPTRVSYVTSELDTSKLVQMQCGKRFLAAGLRTKNWQLVVYKRSTGSSFSELWPQNWQLVVVRDVAKIHLSTCVSHVSVPRNCCPTRVSRKSVPQKSVSYKSVKQCLAVCLRVRVCLRVSGLHFDELLMEEVK